jgi:serine phosphatase RsbU (regulator of sigma subunit)
MSRVLREKQACIVADIAVAPDWQTGYGHAPAGGSWLAVPLLAKDAILGLLEVWHSRSAAFGAEDAEVLGILAGQVAVTLSHARLYAESVQRLAHELQVASQVQQHLFPTRAPALPGLNIATFYRPAYETTGDFYAFVTGQVAANNSNAGTRAVDLIIGDVSGKSLPAALLMAMARTALSTAARTQEGDPVGALQWANTVLLGEMPRGSFVAGTYAHFNRDRRSLALVNAAQPAPLLVRNGTAELLEGSGDHWPLGIVAEPQYEAFHLHLQPGDVLLFYTDGLIEAFNPAGEMFGFERLQEVVAVCPAQADPYLVIEQVIAAGTTWINGSLQHDDIAIVAVCVTEEW